MWRQVNVAPFGLRQLSRQMTPGGHLNAKVQPAGDLYSMGHWDIQGEVLAMQKSPNDCLCLVETLSFWWRTSLGVSS